MASMSGWEFLLIVIIGLVVLGPQRLNRLANQLGGWIGQARRMTRQMRRQLEDELHVDDNFMPKTPGIAPPIKSAPPDSADPAYDYDSDAESSAEPEPYIPHDDDTYSVAHDEAEDDADSDGKKEPGA